MVRQHPSLCCDWGCY